MRYLLAHNSVTDRYPAAEYQGMLVAFAIAEPSWKDLLLRA